MTKSIITLWRMLWPTSSGWCSAGVIMEW